AGCLISNASACRHPLPASLGLPAKLRYLPHQGGGGGRCLGQRLLFLSPSGRGWIGRRPRRVRGGGRELNIRCRCVGAPPPSFARPYGQAALPPPSRGRWVPRLPHPPLVTLG